MEPRPVLAVSLNSAWQKTLNFGQLALGSVNRAQSCHGAGGGKGVNVARVLRRLGVPVGVAAFAGGHPGECLRQEFAQSGVLDLTVSTRGVTRCCYTVIDRERGQATELIEPSAAILSEEVEAMRQLLREQLPRFGALAICGSVPPGIPRDFYAEMVGMARSLGLPVVLDTVHEMATTLREGATLLKINADELAQLAAGETCRQQAADLLQAYPRLQWLAVTAGPEPAWLFRQQSTQAWKISLPSLPRIVSPIGAGDCATAIMTRRLAQQPQASQLAEAFAEALACASASCLTDTPSLFEPQLASDILAQATIESLA